MTFEIKHQNHLEHQKNKFLSTSEFLFSSFWFRFWFNFQLKHKKSITITRTKAITVFSIRLNMIPTSRACPEFYWALRCEGWDTDDRDVSWLPGPTPWRRSSAASRGSSSYPAWNGGLRNDNSFKTLDLLAVTLFFFSQCSLMCRETLYSVVFGTADWTRADWL